MKPMTLNNQDQPAIPPNIEHLAVGLRHIGTRMGRMMNNERLDTSATEPPLGPVEFAAQLTEITQGLLAFYYGIGTATAECFEVDVAKMHDDRLDEEYVERRLDAFRDEVENVLRVRRALARALVEPELAHVQTAMLEVVDRYLRQFAEFASGLLDRIGHELGSGNRRIIVRFSPDLEETVDELERAMSETTTILEQRNEKSAESQDRRSWGWLWWIPLLFAWLVSGVLDVAGRKQESDR